MSSVDGAKDERERLSELPEELLAHILSLVPLKTAIKTGILSRRWRDFWTKLPCVKLCVDSDFYKQKKGGPHCFDYEDVERFYENDFSAEHKRGEFFTIIDNIFSKLSSKSLRSVNLNLGHYRGNKLYNSKTRNCRHILKWFNWTCGNKEKLEEFRFTVIPAFCETYSQSFPHHPLLLFQMTSLVVLELRPWFYDSDANYDFNLPNLKKLNVEMYPWNPRILEKLVLSSPSLEDLSFLALWVSPRIPIPNSDTLRVSTHTLKRLTMDLQLKDPIHVIVNAPKLDYLGVDANNHKLLPTSLRYRLSFVNPPTALLAAYIFTDYFSLGTFFLLSNFFTLLSTVVSLSIVDQKPDPMIAPITFTRLTHLKLRLCHYSSDNRKTLLPGLALLEQCPLLEALTLDLTDNHCYPILLPDLLPQRLVTCVKRIELVAHPYVRGLDDILSLLFKYFIGKTQALELLRIIINPPPVPDEYQYYTGSYDELRSIKEFFQIEAESLSRQYELVEISERVEDKKLMLSNMLMQAKVVEEHAKTKEDHLSGEIRSILVSGNLLTISQQRLQESNRLLAGERGYTHLHSLWKMLRVRQQQMIARVSFIYPVKTVIGAAPELELEFIPNGSIPETTGGSGDDNRTKNPGTLSISGVQLSMIPFTQLSLFNDKKQMQNSTTALGYVAHAISLIASYLHVPLRYPLRLGGSHSYIKDYSPFFEPASLSSSSSPLVSSKRKCLEFPLFLDGQDVTRAAYAIFLLNKDIEQLLNYVGVESLGPRRVLANLKELYRIILSPEFVEKGRT